MDIHHSISIALVSQMVKNLPALQEAWVQSLGQEDPLEKEMATHSSILTWEIPWTQEIYDSLMTKPPLPLKQKP